MAINAHKIKRTGRGVIVNWDRLTLRGSFINIVYSLTILFLIVFGAFDKLVAENLSRMETLIIGAFITSLGLWKGKQGFDYLVNMKYGGPTQPAEEGLEK